MSKKSNGGKRMPVIRLQDIGRGVTGLSFSFHPSSLVEGNNLEAIFVAFKVRQGRNVDRLLAVGYGVIHSLLTIALLRSGALWLASVALATALQHFGAAYLSIRRPDTYSSWRLILYSSNILWSALEATVNYRHSSYSPCMSETASLYWISEFVNTNTPWLVLHSLMYQLPMPVAIGVNMLALVITAFANPSRCQASLSSCPSGRQTAHTVYQWLRRNFGMFSASIAEPNAVPVKFACVGVYSLVQLFSLVAALHFLWRTEHSARLDFLADTDAVDVECSLERLKKPVVVDRIGLVVELAMAMALFGYILTTGVAEIARWAPNIGSL